MSRGKYKRKSFRQQRRSTSIHASGLSERVVRILEAHNINTLYDLDVTPDEDLAAMPRIGEKAMSEIHAVQVHIPAEGEDTRRRKKNRLAADG